MSTTRRWWPALALALGWMTASLEAHADVERQGTWPAEERHVSLDLEQTPLRQALRRLADAAGWSLVLPSGLDEPVDVQVRDQPADRVLEALLASRSFVAQRSGDLIQLRLTAPTTAPGAASLPALPTLPAVPALPAMPAVPSPGAPPVPPASAEAGAKAGDDRAPADRTVAGSSARIGRDETVRNLVVLGGSVDIDGTVTGDVTVVGGSVRVRRGGHVKGNVLALLGSARAEDGSQIDGHMGALGGAALGTSHAHGDTTSIKAPVAKARARLGSSMTSASMLFLLGVVLWSLLAPRMERLQTAVARQPMRSFAIGLVTLVGGGVLLTALCVSFVGIPVAVAGALVGVLAAYAGLCAVLQTAGRALLGHRTPNPYAHLALGCLLLMAATYLPWVGDYVSFMAALTGLGAAVTTGLGGLTRPLFALPGQGPYRTGA